MGFTRRKVSVFFAIFSLVFLFSGLYSAHTLAEIEHQRNFLLSTNPQNVELYLELNNTSYTLTLHMSIKNTGPYSFKIFKILWTVYLVNGSTVYQANGYGRYYSEGERLVVRPGQMLNITIVDNRTTHQWSSWLLPHLRWQIEKYGLKNIKWHNTITVKGMLGDFNGEKYRYNVRTWYLWHLPEVVISYDKIVRVS
jgi:archaellum component FlaG (FlaF/FlaG flagellin family)